MPERYHLVCLGVQKQMLQAYLLASFQISFGLSYTAPEVSTHTLP